MRALISKFFVVCSKTGKIRGVKTPAGPYKLLFPLIGLLALTWILIRVIPKPQRINYPCVRAAMPFASGLMIALGTAAVSRFIFLKMKIELYRKPLVVSILIIIAAAPAVIIPYIQAGSKIPVYTDAAPQVNVPMGKGIGIFPGRVAWVYYPRATNDNCNPKSYGHSYYMNENTFQGQVDTMLWKALLMLTGKNTDSAAWNAIFMFHNNARGKGYKKYQPGEKIFIKINATSSWASNINASDLTPVNNSSYGISETTPQMISAVLRQLVYNAGVAQNHIYVGDPMKHIYKHSYDIMHSEFPNVHYLDHDNGTIREKVVKSTTSQIFYSDRGTVLKSNGSTGTPITSDYLYTIFEQCEYMINLPMLKGHRRAGITIFAKNHFGSHTRDNANHVHGGLVAPEEVITRPDYGLYRVQVDLMGHKLLGKKNLVYLLDALWATDYELDVPVKWKMWPFNNRWMSSIFASFDPVAIESVGYDFLRAEFTASRGLGTYPQMSGTDDYLHQAADTANWPASIKYDPDSSGIHLKSMGVHEHWNSSSGMAYSRNLGGAEGIELVPCLIISKIDEASSSPASFVVFKNYPNPFNPTTVFEIFLPYRTTANLTVYSTSGKRVKELFTNRELFGRIQYRFDPASMPAGVYYAVLRTERESRTIKLLYLK